MHSILCTSHLTRSQGQTLACRSRQLLLFPACAPARGSGQLRQIAASTPHTSSNDQRCNQNLRRVNVMLASAQRSRHAGRATHNLRKQWKILHKRYTWPGCRSLSQTSFHMPSNSALATGASAANLFVGAAGGAEATVFTTFVFSAIEFKKGVLCYYGARAGGGPGARGAALSYVSVQRRVSI